MTEEDFRIKDYKYLRTVTHAKSWIPLITDTCAYLREKLDACVDTERSTEQQKAYLNGLDSDLHNITRAIDEIKIWRNLRLKELKEATK